MRSAIDWAAWIGLMAPKRLRRVARFISQSANSSAAPNRLWMASNEQLEQGGDRFCSKDSGASTMHQRADNEAALS